MTTTIEYMRDGEWCDIEVEVLQIWDNEHPAIRQVGIVRDETGIVKFVAWEKSDLPLMEKDVMYKIRNVVVSAYEDRLQISLNSNTTIARVGSVQTEIPTDADLERAETEKKNIPTV
jgi:replication factor A1